MAKLAIFIDGAYLNFANKDHFGEVSIDYVKLAGEVRATIAGHTLEPVDLLRTLFYTCPPYQSNPPTDEERKRTAAYRGFANALKDLPRFELREGRLAFRGTNAKGAPIFQQKRVDLMLGLDCALLCGKRQITHIALVAGDSDFVPALKVAKDEGISTWLLHGPQGSYHRDLWQEADERHELTSDFIKRCTR
jgi:uncharacterized LabA/DUF88 family protein